MFLRTRMDHDTTSPRKFLDLCHTQQDLPNWSWEILHAHTLRDAWNNRHTLAEIKTFLPTVSEHGRPLAPSDRPLFRNILLPALSHAITSQLTQLPDAVYLREHWSQMIDALEQIHVLIERDLFLLRDQHAVLSARLEQSILFESLPANVDSTKPCRMNTLKLYHSDPHSCLATTLIESWTPSLIWVSDPDDANSGAVLPSDFVDELTNLPLALDPTDTNTSPTPCTLALSQWLIDTILHSDHPTASDLHEYHQQQAEELQIERPGLPKKQYQRAIAYSRLIERRSVDDTLNTMFTKLTDGRC